MSFLHSQDDGLPPNFVYLEPIEDFYAYNPITIEIIVTDRNALDRVSLFYRFSGNPDYVQREMSVSHQPVVYDVEIPLEEVESGHIQYFFWAKDEFGNQATWPEGGEDLPMVLPVYPKKPEKEKKRSVTQVSVDYTPPENLVDNLPYYLKVGMLSPPGEVTQKEGVAVIVLSVFDSEEITNLDSTRMIIDSTQVSAFISSDMLTFVPIESFEPGYHIVRYESVKKNGEVLQKDFSFFVHESIFEEDIEVITWQEKYKFKGNIGWNTDIDPSPSRPFDTHKFNSSVKFILGDTKFNIQGLTNLHIIDGDARSEAEFRQPTERLKLKINSPMIDFNYGDSSPEFSEFSLKGTRIRGLNTKFKWGNWKTTFVGGETKHWVSSDTKTLSKWDSLSTYLPGESIYYNGEIWQAEILNTASIPDTSNGDWNLPEESDYTFISNDVCTEVQAALYGVDPVMGGDTLSVWNGSECEEVILYSTINMMTGLDGLEEGLLYEDVETCLQKCKVPVVYQKGSPIRNLQGFRTENDFFNHLKLGISTIRSWDVRNNNLTPFSVFHQGYAYEGNMVTAADFSLHFNHDKTVLQGEYGFSITMDQSIPDTLMLKAAHGIDAGDNLYSYSSWEGVDYCYQNNCVDINGDGKITSQPEFQSGVAANDSLWKEILKTKDTMEGYSKLLGFSLNDDILGFGEGRGISGLTGPEFGNLVKGGSDSLHLLTKRPAVKLLFKTPIPLYFTTLDVQGEFNQAPLNFVSHGSSSIQTDVRNYKSKA
ncbi:MAG: hypothetical protein QGF57_04325, partial [Candidatus Marinimicrobia bacterium]|nr:hypothetical protein [Candidatus Neomarinimicrobiota bacterium]